MSYQQSEPTGQGYNLVSPTGREVLSMKLNDIQGGHPRNLRNDRNIYQNEYITEQISNDPNHVQRHADLNLKMRNPLFHEFHYKKVVQPQYTIPQHKSEMEQVNTMMKNNNNADSLDMYQQNFLARQKNVDRAKWGNNLMNYDLTKQQSNQSPTYQQTPQQLISPKNIYPSQQDYPLENYNQNRRGSPQPVSQQYQQNIPQRSNIENSNIFAPQRNQQQEQLQQPNNLVSPSIQQQQRISGSRQVQSQANLQKTPGIIQMQGGNYSQDDNFQNNQMNNDNQQRQNFNNNANNPNQNNQRYKDFDNPQYQKQLEQQERQFNQQRNQISQKQDQYLNKPQSQQQNYQPENKLAQSNIPPSSQNNQINYPNSNRYSSNPNDYPQQNNNNQQNYQNQRNNIGSQQQQQYQQNQEQLNYNQQQNNNDQVSPDLLNDKRMKKIYNPLVQKVGALYEPRYGVNAVWDKYDRDLFKNWQNRDQHYQNIVRSKNFILDLHNDYTTENHEYGTMKLY